MNNSDFEAKYKQLQQRFLDSLPGDFALIQQHMGFLRMPAMYDLSLKELHFIIHRYSGNGLTFGFPEISTTASALEDIIRVLIQKEDVEENIKKARDMLPRLAKAFRITL